MVVFVIPSSPQPPGKASPPHSPFLPPSLFLLLSMSLPLCAAAAAGRLNGVPVTAMQAASYTWTSASRWWDYLEQLILWENQWEHVCGRDLGLMAEWHSSLKSLQGKKKVQRSWEVGGFQEEQTKKEREEFYPGKKSVRKSQGSVWELFLMKRGQGSALEFQHSRGKHEQKNVYWNHLRHFFYYWNLYFFLCNRMSDEYWWSVERWKPEKYNHQALVTILSIHSRCFSESSHKKRDLSVWSTTVSVDVSDIMIWLLLNLLSFWDFQSSDRV